MFVQISLNPNCSEAVFRFYTVDPEQVRRILQAFANEVAQANGTRPEVIPQMERIEHVESIHVSACAGLGEPVTACHFERAKNAWVLCIGNNDISPHGEGCTTVRDLGIPVEEAETSPSVANRWARDCTCGIEWFADYPGRIVEDTR